MKKLIQHSSFYADFKYCIWLRNNFDDTIITTNKILFEGGVSLRNGIISHFGDIGPSDYNVINTDSGTYIRFDNLTKTYNLSNVNQELVQVDMSSDGGDNELYEIERIVNYTPTLMAFENINFSVNPNPATNVSNIIFESNIASNYEIKLFNSNGALISIIAAGANYSNTPLIWPLDYSLLSNGINYLSLKRNNKFYILKVIKS